ncbi:MAG: nucleotidyltransferase domain-containing protein [Lachnospiraceae bacterium]|nr:nucleotidyltransferase domain-containing protein [Lachnospiraceae bacterium]MBQ1400164.1 nucleotidyltransferase domain-containing protein [Lachnospiraceae bacterium]
MKDTILEYIRKTYDPDAVIVYGSFADGSESAHSDFDALVIAGDRPVHDSSVVGGIQLDVFVYPPETFRSDCDPADFIQIFDGKILLDRNGDAARLKEKVAAYAESRPLKTAEEKRQEIEWCRKMMLRAGRGDAEGYYRRHWLLIDSLEIWSDLRNQRYFGPKKTLRRMEREDPEGFRLYEAALEEFTQPALAAWVEYLETYADGR